MNLEKLKGISPVKTIEELHIDDLIDRYKTNELKDRARNYEKNMYAYKMTYESNGHSVVGYIAEPREGEKLPCIIYCRGGSNNFGKIDDENVFLGRFARLANEGYIVIASQYSGNDGGEGKDQFGGEDIDDVIHLYKILKEYYRADTSRIGIMGGSRGGLMAYMCLAKVNWIKAAVMEFTPTDLFDKDQYRPEFKTHLESMFGNKDEDKEIRSAQYFADKLPKNVPILIMHGTADWRVNPMDSLRMAEKLQQNKVPYRLIMFEGADHGITEFRKEATSEMLKWLDRYVKNLELLPNLEKHGE